MAKETAELRKSIAESRKETAELRESMAKETAELRKSIAELTVNVDELRITTDKIGKKLEQNTNFVGKLTNKIGKLVESIVLPGIIDKFNEKGFEFDSIATNIKLLKSEKAGNLAEIDALLENGKFVIAVEAKTDMQISDVNSHIKRLNALRKHPRFKGKKIYGAFSTAVIRRKPVNYALEQGFYVLQQPDVLGVKILDFPKGCSAKAW